MRGVESTCHKISLYSRRIISLLPDAVIACRGCIVGISKRWRRNRSGVRVGVEKVCQGRSKTRPVRRSKSRPEEQVGEQVGDRGLSGRRTSGAKGRSEEHTA